jgi:hypothetical protein
MSQSLFSRFAGPIVLVTGLLLIVAQVILLASYDATDRVATVHNPAYLAGGVLYFVGFGGLLVSLAAAYQRQAQEAGLPGLIGMAAAMIGTLFLGGDLWFETFAVPWLGDVAPDVFSQAGGILMVGGFTSYVLFAAGWALFGLASLRARVFPMTISLTIIAGGVIGFQALIPPYGLPLAVAITSLGVWMTRGSTAGAKHAGPLVTAALLVVSVMTAGCSALTGTRGEGPITTESRHAAAFNKVDASYGIAVTISVGPAQPLEVHAQANILPIIETSVDGSTLHIRGTKEFNTSEPVKGRDRHPHAGRHLAERWIAGSGRRPGRRASRDPAERRGRSHRVGVCRRRRADLDRRVRSSPGGPVDAGRQPRALGWRNCDRECLG